MGADKDSTAFEPIWLRKIRRAGPYVIAGAVGALLTQTVNFAQGIGNLYTLLQKPAAFTLAENTAKSTFSDQLAQRAWRRLFWADNFRARVVALTPIEDIDASWKEYIVADADWNANIMISIVGLEQYYGERRSAQLEGKIQKLFSDLDEKLASLRNSETVKAIRSGSEPTPTQKENSNALADEAKDISNTLKVQLYILVRCFASENRGQNLCT